MHRDLHLTVNGIVMVIYYSLVSMLGVLLAVDAVVNHLKTMSRNVTTPEEIAQVSDSADTDNIVNFFPILLIFLINLC